MGKQILHVLIFVLFIKMSMYAQVEKAFLSTSLEALWKTAPVFNTPESVYFSKNYNLLFVSNLNGNPSEKDGNGYISVLTPEGNIIELKWITGLNAPKGMGIYKDRLYVADIDRIAEIDITTKTIVKFYPIPNAIFLNDIVVDKNGDIYISDMHAKTIYKISKHEIKRWIVSDKMHNPNGLCISDGFLYVGTTDRIIKICLVDKTISDYILSTGSVDGLICFGENHIIYSDWYGNIFFAGLGKETTKILDTTPLKINAADIGFINEKNILLVPTFYDNRIMAYKISMPENIKQ